jgi:FMN-dependent NADH-azoreductase
MILNMKRKRIHKEREEAVPQRERAARDFVAAIREAEAALDALKAANDRFYRSDVQHEQAELNDLRRSRDRMFQFTAAKDVVAEAPMLARLLGVKVAPTQAMPFIDFVIHTGKLDLPAVGGSKETAA